MRIRTAAAVLALPLLALTACSGGDDKPSTPAAAPKPSPSSSAPSTDLRFGQTYTWPDGVKVSVVSSKTFTDYNADDGESHDPAYNDFRTLLKVTNGGKAPVDLSGLSVVTEGATSGGEAESGTWENGSQPLEGRLAPGATATKTDDESLETQYGKRIVVRVQRVSDVPEDQWPEFTGSIG